MHVQVGERDLLCHASFLPDEPPAAPRSASLRPLDGRETAPLRRVSRAGVRPAQPRRAALLALVLTAPALRCASTAVDPRAARLESLWKLYLSEDERWAAAREEWLQQGPAEIDLYIRRLLVELLFTGDHDAESRGRRPRWQRARSELNFVRSEALPYLLHLMKLSTEKQPVDPIGLDRCAQTLASLQAFEELSSLLQSGRGSTPLRCAFVRALGQMGDPRAPAVLAQRFPVEESWEVRGQIVSCFEDRGSLPPSDQDWLVAALGDPDRFVRMKAARALQHTRTAAARAALVDALARSVSAGDEREARAIHVALKENSGVEMLRMRGGSFPRWQDVRAWRMWIEAIPGAAAVERVENQSSP